jgi:hypothetical protein
VTLRQWADDTLAEATGRDLRHDPIQPTTGGPAGNARLTAWTGVVLLVLFVIEMVTVLDIGGLIDWHIVVGTLLVPPALLKTGSTGWRIVRYYTRRQPYRRAGPPPMPLRLLGPLVVLFTLAVLGSGIALVALGPDAGRTSSLAVGGFGLSALTVHKVTFVLWGAVTGVHTLARLVPAARIIAGRGRGRVPGRIGRVITLVLVLGVAVLTAVILIGLSGAWTSGAVFHHAAGVPAARFGAGLG